jgi:hypothetical protein
MAFGDEPLPSHQHRGERLCLDELERRSQLSDGDVALGSCLRPGEVPIEELDVTAHPFAEEVEALATCGREEGRSCLRPPE